MRRAAAIACLALGACGHAPYEGLYCRAGAQERRCLRPWQYVVRARSGLWRARETKPDVVEVQRATPDELGLHSPATAGQPWRLGGDTQIVDPFLAAVLAHLAGHHELRRLTRDGHLTSDKLVIEDAIAIDVDAFVDVGAQGSAPRQSGFLVPALREESAGTYDLRPEQPETSEGGERGFTFYQGGRLEGWGVLYADAHGCVDAVSVGPALFVAARVRPDVARRFFDEFDREERSGPPD
jgi:hypothetical protein